MNIEDRIIDLLTDEFGDSKNRGFRALSEYKYQGINVPRVTVILQSTEFDKALLNWVNFIGFKHIDYKQMLDNASLIGRQTHSFIESFIQQKENYKAPVRTEVVNCTNAFKDWWRQLNFSYSVKVIAEEQPLTCPWFGGTFDLLLEIDGKRTLIDFKTSNHITFRYFIQLAAYKYLIQYNYNMPIDAACILRMDKENAQYEMAAIDLSNEYDNLFMEHCTYTFFSQLNTYYAIARTKHEFNKLYKKDALNTTEIKEEGNSNV
ncbi:MAG: hypothetical protein IJ193_09745 [Bacilli bacterium]|nr:hypothetical protein [Bacilli bacterium]